MPGGAVDLQATALALTTAAVGHTSGHWRLLRRLDLPEGIGANALPGVLARLVTLEELAALTARLREEEEG